MLELAGLVLGLAVAASLVLVLAVAASLVLVVAVAALLVLVVAAFLAGLVAGTGTVHRTGAGGGQGAAGTDSVVVALQDGWGEQSEPELKELKTGSAQSQKWRGKVLLAGQVVPGMVGGG